jgi:hypothetical protein
LSTMRYLAREVTIGPMENSTKVLGKQTRCMAKGS